MAKLLIDTDIITSLCKDSEKIIFDEGATRRALLACYVLGTDFSKVESSKDIEKIFKKVLKKRMTFQYYQTQRQYVLETLLRIKKNLNYLTFFMLFIAVMAIDITKG